MLRFPSSQVSKNFTEIFRRLVPNGHGQLVMRVEDGDEEEDRELEEEADISDRFVGVGKIVTNLPAFRLLLRYFQTTLRLVLIPKFL